MISFLVYGVPVGQGSKTRGQSGTKTWIRDDNAKTLKPWRDRIANAAADAHGGAPLLLGPVVVHVSFGFPRLKAHYGAGGKLKAGAPTLKVTKPDVDKLVRALFDALTGVVWHDDGQVVSVRASKAYGDPPRTEVRIVELPHA